MTDRALHIDRSRCAGCGRCVAACRLRLLTLETSGYRKYAFLRRPDDCSLCLRCSSQCRLEAIAVSQRSLLEGIDPDQLRKKLHPEQHDRDSAGSADDDCGNGSEKRGGNP